MAFSKQRQKIILSVLVAVLVLANVYRFVTAEKPRTAPLTYAPGAVAVAPVRRGIPSPAASSDPLAVFFARRQESFPGVGRDLFRMENPVKTKPKPVAPVAPPPPTVPEKTPEEIAAELAKADLSKFRFLGYVTDKGDRSLFLSKDGETFIVKSGDRVLKNYKVRDAGKDYVLLQDTVTGVEVRVELSGSGPESAVPPQPQRSR